MKLGRELSFAVEQTRRGGVLPALHLSQRLAPQREHFLGRSERGGEEERGLLCGVILL